MKTYRTILADPPWDIEQKGSPNSLGAIRHQPGWYAWDNEIDSARLFLAKFTFQIG